MIHVKTPPPTYLHNYHNCCFCLMAYISQNLFLSLKYCFLTAENTWEVLQCVITKQNPLELPGHSFNSCHWFALKFNDIMKL